MTSVKHPVPATRTEAELALLSRDNVQVDDFSIMRDGETVILTEQSWGKWPKQRLAISRRTFNKLIRWYWEGNVPREDAKSRKPPKKEQPAGREE
jgi:hypothetical protein